MAGFISDSTGDILLRQVKFTGTNMFLFFSMCSLGNWIIKLPSRAYWIIFQIIFPHMPLLVFCKTADFVLDSIITNSDTTWGEKYALHLNTHIHTQYADWDSDVTFTSISYQHPDISTSNLMLNNEVWSPSDLWVVLTFLSFHSVRKKGQWESQRG